jgi:hypothetical protein
MPEWLSDLEKVLASLTPNADFRLFLTSEPHDLFPPVLLRQCLKITYEAPPGLKKNIARTFDNWKEDGRFVCVCEVSLCFMFMGVILIRVLLFFYLLLKI